MRSHPRSPLRLPEALAAAALLLVFALQLVHVARLYSATWDEAHHLYDGYTVWTRHDFRLNPEVPPLVKLTAALPLLPMHLYAPPNQGRSEPKEAFLDGRAFVFGNGGDRVLLRARLACILFPLLLAVLVFAAAREMFGSVAAFAALLLFVFDPNVLANGTLVTTDLGSACCLFGAVYAFFRYCTRPSPARLALVALAAGLTLVVKFTGILLLPMFLLLALAEALRARSLRVLWQRLGAVTITFLVAWGMVWAFYGFRYKAAPPGLELSPALLPYIQSMPNGKNVRELTLAAHLRLLPEPYLWGLANTRKTEWEYTSYFFGRMYRHGPWEYFPAAFLIKSTLPLPLLLCLLPFVWRRSREGDRGRKLAFLLLPVAVYFAVITSSHFDIGARHLLPVYPFLYVLAAGGVAAAMGRGPVWAGLAAVLLLWQVGTSVRVAPNYMAYGNEAWGGPLEVHRYLSDANVDWGQQLKTVRQYLETNHIQNCWFVYFPDGAVEPADYRVHCHRLPTPTALWWLDLPMEVPPAIDGTVLISDSDLEGVETGDGPALNPYDSFRGLKPVAVLQDGVDVYQGHFELPLASALVAARRSGELAAQGQTTAALETARHAVALAPDSAIVQLNLADTLAAQAQAPSQWSEALSHYGTANSLIHAIRPDLQLEDLLPRATAGIAKASAHLRSDGVPQAPADTAGAH